MHSTSPGHRQAVPGFERLGRIRVPALGGALASYAHRPTGARHLHLDLPTEDCAFLMAFLTPAPDSTGLTHVLEHLVMCGSERYPCRRAFFSMLGRTLSTTMNALTTEDCTACHFSTRSLHDYENLLSVYLDAAFFPRLDRLDFEQEGCRVEIGTAGGEGGVPVRRGVVLSEMRGLMNEPAQQLQQALNRCLFPSTPYRFNAGGDPWRIPALDYETLRTYHRRHYHPGNAVFLSAGPLPPEWLHDRLQELALTRFPRRGPPAAPFLASLDPPPLEAPSRSVAYYPVVCAADTGGVAGTADATSVAGTTGTASTADMVAIPPGLTRSTGSSGASAAAGVAETTGSAGTARQGQAGASVALAWRLGDASDPVSVIRARLLARCLLEQGDAPLRRALEMPGSPAAALASNGVQETRRRIVFQCGVHGCDPNLAGEIEARVLAAVDTAASHGFDEIQVDGALAQIERALRERHDPRYPFPLKLLIRMLPAALYGGEPAAALDVPRTLATLRAETRSRRDTAELVRRHLRDNPERVTVTAIPDPAAARRLDAEDRARLERAYGGPARRQARDRVIERSRALRRRQRSQAGESSLPKIRLDTIGPPRKPPELCAPSTGTSHAEAGRDPATEPAAAPPTEAAGAPRVWISRGPTGGLAYARLAVDVTDFAPERLDDVGLLCEVLPESGHGRLTPAQTRTRLAHVCDRLSAEPWILARAAPGSGAAESSIPGSDGGGSDGGGSGAPGLDASAPDAFGVAPPRMWVVLSGRAQASDEEALLEVLADAHLEARFDRNAREAAAKARVRRSGELARNGHIHAERIAAARLGPSAAMAERWHGPSALAILAQAAEGRVESGSGSGTGGAAQLLEDRLYRVHRALAAAPLRLQIVRDPDSSRPGGAPGRFWSERRAFGPPAPTLSGGRSDGAVPRLGDRAPAPPAPPRSGGRRRDPAPRTEQRPPESSPEHPAAARTVAGRAPAAGAWIADGPVNYCAKVYPAVAAEHPDAGPLAVLAAFAGGDLLQRAVRERGGAYGAGARYCGRTCTVRMFSYRDPRLAETLRDFDRAIEALHRHPPEGHRLEEAILRAVREIDKPRAFQIAAFERYLDELQGRGPEGVRALRASVLGTGPERLREVAERHLRPEQGCAGVLAGAGREDELDRLRLPWRRL